mmetsp:Transcript_24953/g.34386  ORF Transcript_24953/g.34386 Transcript_24953/m.34386 type:complete len:144 (+) Transcript_24953:196-627(+)
MAAQLFASRCTLLGSASRSSSLCGALLSQRFAYSSSRVIEVLNDAQFGKELSDHPGLVVVDFTAKWCGPCKVVAPKYDAMSLDFPAVKFLKVDIDNEDTEQTVSEARIKAVPTFQLFKSSASVSTIQGADMDSLKTKIVNHSK